MPLTGDHTMHTQFDTHKVLAHIHHIICKVDVLKWLGSVPKNFGNKATGMIKMAEWCSLATVYLPIALISLWRSNTEPDLHVVLNYTMYLILAIYLACACTTDNNHTAIYQNCITGYVGKLKTVYPAFSVQPNHHTYFHIYDYLILFGLVHSCWSLPFECLIRTL